MPTERSDRFVERAMHEIAAQKDVLDVGGGGRFGKWLKTYKHLFDATNYRTFDYDASTGADVVGDIHAIPLPDGSINAIICSSVLEHVRDPRTAMQQLTRILKPGGKLFLYVPSIYPYHARVGHYPDLWRFFEDTVRDFCNEYSVVELEKRGGYFFALSFFVPFQHRLRFILTPMADFLDTVFRTAKRSTTAGYYVLATK